MTDDTTTLMAALAATMRNGTVCMTVPQMATTAGISESRVRRTLRRLVDRGLLTPAGRHHRTTIFRFASVSREQATADRLMAERDLETSRLVDEPLTPETRDQYRRISEHLAERYGGQRPLPDPAGHGACQDCLTDTLRYPYHGLDLCARCYRDRCRVAANELDDPSPDLVAELQGRLT